MRVYQLDPFVPAEPRDPHCASKVEARPSADVMHAKTASPKLITQQAHIVEAREDESILLLELVRESARQYLGAADAKGDEDLADRGT